MSKNTKLSQLINYVQETADGRILLGPVLPVDDGSTTLQINGSLLQTFVTSALVKANSTGKFIAAVAGTDYQAPLGFIPANSATTLTINGVTYDLSANRSWTVSAGGGTVTSVAATAGTGISVSVANPTTTPNITITNTAPDQVVSISAGTGINVTGTYPSFTVAATSAGSVTSVTASSPLASSGGATPNITITQATTSTDGYLSSIDWNAFNGKQSALSGTGFVKISGTTISYDNTTYYPYPTGTTSQYVRGDGSLATFPGLTGYIPYTGATTNVNLGEYGITSGYVAFDLTPTATPTGVSTMFWDPIYRTVALIDGDGDTTLQIGQEERILIHNGTGVGLTDGQVVYVTGSTGELPSVSLADASSEATSAATLGVVTEAIANGADGFITVSGIVHGLNTLAFTEGDILWLSETAGEFTNVKPIAPAHLVLIGYVIKRAGGNGSILVKIQNTQELSESSDVLISSPEVDGQGLFLQTISGTQLWRNRSISDVLGYTPEQPLTFSSPLSRSTNTVSIPAATSSVNGYLTSTDWSTFNSKQATISLTTTGSSGASTFISNTLNVPTYTLSGLGGQPLATNLTSLSGLTYASTSFVKMTASGTFSLDTTEYGTGTVTSVAALTLGTTGTDVSSSVANGTTTPVITLNIPTASATNRGALSSTDWSTFNGKQNAITLTTTGTSGAATFSAGTLNIPQYQAALTNPITGSLTTNYLPKATAATTLGDSLIYDSGTAVLIGTTTASTVYTENALTVYKGANTSLEVRANGSQSSLALTLSSGSPSATYPTVEIFNSYNFGILYSGGSSFTNYPLYYNGGNGAGSGDYLTLGTAGQTRMTVLNSGQVGIGTASPNTLLGLKYNNGSSGTVMDIQNTNATGASAIDFYNNTGSYLGNIGGAASHGSLVVDSWVGGTSFKVSNVEAAKIATTKQLRLNGYTTTSSFTGTPVGTLGFDSSGNILTMASATGTITGSGTTGNIVKFTGTSAIGNSIMSESGSVITVTGTITETSALKYKENVETITGALDSVLKLRGVTYNKIGEDQKEIGVIAEEVYEVAPELVTFEEGEINSVAYARTVALLIEAVKEQQKQIDELKSLLGK